MDKSWSIYLLLDEHCQPQYVGCTSDIVARSKAHLKRFPHLRFEQQERFSEMRAALHRERELIRQMQPPLNTVHTDHPRRPRKPRVIHPRPRPRPRRPPQRQWPGSQSRLTRADMDARLARAARQYWQEQNWV